MKKFTVLLRKELRELITPVMIVPLVLTVALFLSLGKITAKEAEKAKQPHALAVMDLDASPASAQIKQALAGANFRVEDMASLPVEEAVSKAESQKDAALVVIPSGFGASLAAGTPAPLRSYAILTSLSSSGTQAQQSLKAAFAILNQSVGDQLVSHAGLNPAFIKQPLATQEYVAVEDRIAKVGLEDVLGFVQSESYFIPLILFIVISFAAQLIATSIASEKENKTLETLLSSPVSRQAIVAAKLVAAGLLALLFASVYMFAFRSYMDGVTGGQALNGASAGALAALGLKFSLGGYLLLGTSLFFGILFALALALILGSFAEDVKGSQGMIAPLNILILIPYFLVIFLDFNAISPALKWLVYALPFSHPFLAPQYVALHQYWPVVWGILYQALAFGALVYAAGRIFSSDHIMTMKLNFSKKPFRPGE